MCHFAGTGNLLYALYIQYIVGILLTFTMAEIRSCDVPGSWRILLYVGAMCGSCNVYRCCWLRRWLRCLSIFYQMSMLLAYIILLGVALADPGQGNTWDRTFNRYVVLMQYFTIILLNIVVVWQTCFGSGIYGLFENWNTFQTVNSYTPNHKLQRGVIKLVVGVIVITCCLTWVGYLAWHMANARMSVAPYLFPALASHTTLNLVFWVHTIIQVPAMIFFCIYALLCFVVLVDITYILRALREDMECTFSVTTVDSVALERCLQSINGICELVDAVNGTFGVSLAVYLIWVVPNLINNGLQLIQWQQDSSVVFLPWFAFALIIFILILVPPAVTAAQVRTLCVTVKKLIHYNRYY